MAYGNQNRGSYGNKTASAPAKTTTAAPVASGNGERAEPLLERFVNTSKSGKAQTFFVGKGGLNIPENTRVIIAALTDKQIAGLTRVSKERGFKTVPTHKLMVYPADVQEG